MGFFDKIKAGLKKTRDSITGQINSCLLYTSPSPRDA